MTGQELRGKIEMVQDELGFVEEFISDNRYDSNSEIASCLERCRENLEELFYLIPLDKER